jgi:hypothetical protein
MARADVAVRVDHPFIRQDAIRNYQIPKDFINSGHLSAPRRYLASTKTL